MLRLGIPVIGVTDVPRAAAFWSAAPDLVTTDEWQSGTWRTLDHADGSGRGPRPDAQRIPRRTTPPSPPGSLTETAEGQQEEEVRRLVGLGARAVDRHLYPPDPDFVVLADPDGNVFCVVDPSHAPGGGDRPAP